MPRYTSYPTVIAFEPVAGDTEVRNRLSAIRADQSIFAYVHGPFRRRLR